MLSLENIMFIIFVSISFFTLGALIGIDRIKSVCSTIMSSIGNLFGNLSQDNKVLIFVAIIAMVGTIGAAIITASMNPELWKLISELSKETETETKTVEKTTKKTIVSYGDEKIVTFSPRGERTVHNTTGDLHKLNLSADLRLILNRGNLIFPKEE